MSMVYPYIKNADDKLRAECVSGFNEKYPEGDKREIVKKWENELEIIRNRRAASGYLIVSDALKAVGVTGDQICARGTLGSSLVAYLLGITNVDPVLADPPLYSEFFYGMSGERRPSFELTVPEDIHEKLADYFGNYQGIEQVEKKYNSKGHLVGVWIGEDIDSIPVEERYGKVFHFNFVSDGNTEESKGYGIRESILETCKPNSFSEYVKCFGLSNGTGTWEENAERLIKEGSMSYMDIIADREDVYELLIGHGIERNEAFSIAEEVRKGKIYKNGWEEIQKKMFEDAKVPEWFIPYCEKIMYLFPRAHAESYLKTRM